MQNDDYYPFDLTYGSYQKTGKQGNSFKYNGKEEINDLLLNMLDYGARFYQPDLGGFAQIDPHADSYNSWTPYNYVANNPILLIDPDGRDWVISRSETDDGVHYSIVFQGAVKNSNGDKTKATDIVELGRQILKQINVSVEKNGYRYYKKKGGK